MDKEAVDAFHAHLDKCGWCDAHPFALCQTGKKLILEIMESELKETK